MLRRAITLFLLLMMPQLTFSQEIDDEEGDDGEYAVDSLLRVYALAKSDTSRLRLCYEIAKETNNVDIVDKYAMEGISLFSGTDSLMLAKLYQYYAWSQSYRENFEISVQYYKKAISLYEKYELYSEMCTSYNNMGTDYYDMKDYSNAWKSLYKSLNIAQEHCDTIDICYCYSQIANLYTANKMFVQAQETALKSFEIAMETNQNGEMGDAASLLSGIYDEDDSTSIRTAIGWGMKSEVYLGMVADTDDYFGTRLTDTYGNLIVLYKTLHDLTGNKIYVDSAAFYLSMLKDYASKNEFHDDKLFILINTIHVKHAKGKYKEALADLQKAENIMKEGGYGYYKIWLYKEYYIIYKMLGDIPNALKYFEMHQEIVAENNNMQAAMEAAAFDARTSVEEENRNIMNDKRLKIEELEASREHYQKTSTTIGIIIATFLTIIIVIFLMLRHARETNATLSYHSEEIQVQQEMILMESENLVDKHRKILQSMNYARRIQMATICSDEELLEVFPSAMYCYRPRELVSGDWYWAMKIGSKKVLAVGGSARHGVPGALVGMLTLNALKDTLGQMSPMSPASPSAILRTVRSKLPEAAKSNKAGATLCIFSHNRIKFAAINQNAMLIKDGEPILMKGDQNKDEFYNVQTGDFILVYSASTKRELLSITPDPNIFCMEMSRLSTEDQMKHINKVFLRHRQSEDLTVVTVKL
ncbi:MAG: hypothetical protein J6U21_01165 [Bacteroidales bacterium]|nr:hypothetical protein [Bacteroidales bacterium]